MKKKLDIYEEQSLLHYNDYNYASLIKERFPQLARLNIQLRFKEPDWASDPEPKEYLYSLESKAYFNIRCPHHECISGGFDLSHDVIKLIEHGDPDLSGTLICQGWQDRERINKHRCLLKVNYVITATYKT